ncbi:hypothetical protein [Hymenobacter cellulosilyticus]|uniref:Uncharacterized protein n=1 Tax=Hymenobacter cellulosilyticus TaxID=2932248 RepID=A0A8T9Q752_9BACT|nr:hypothetical protein [Hymenobacter cellulosilyticus]UOQ72965.1 hypothetical protein MUN79_02985 [Hymenobacter cellulosilyticus]
MRFSTQRLWAGLFMLLLVGAPGVLQAQSWERVMALAATPSSEFTFCNTTCYDAAGNLVVAGSFGGSLTLGSFTLTSAGKRDIFVARLSPAGQWTQAVRAGGTGDDGATALLLLPGGELAVASSFENSLTLGSSMLTSAGKRDIFVARLSPAGQWTQAVRAGGSEDDGISALSLDAAAQLVAVGSFVSPTVTFGTFILQNTIRPTNPLVTLTPTCLSLASTQPDSGLRP